MENFILTLLWDFGFETDVLVKCVSVRVKSKLDVSTEIFHLRLSKERLRVAAAKRLVIDT